LYELSVPWTQTNLRSAFSLGPFVDGAGSGASSVTTMASGEGLGLLASPEHDGTSPLDSVASGTSATPPPGAGRSSMEGTGEGALSGSAARSCSESRRTRFKRATNLGSMLRRGTDKRNCGAGSKGCDPATVELFLRSRREGVCLFELQKRESATGQRK
jgi:hypothetical protein